MVMIPVAVAAGLLASTSMAGPVALPVEHTCGTEDVSHEIRSLWARQQYSQPDNGQNIELGAVFHFCCSSGSECPGDDVAQNGLKVMNEFYAPAKLTWNLRNITRINDPICSQTDVSDSNTMDSLKAQSHQGSVDTLNIVYVPTNQGPGTKGVCIIPPPSNDIAASVGQKDGCVVATSTLPGQATYGQGDPKDVTSVHEAGHWLGLQHTAETGGNGGYSRRQSGGNRNIMEPVQITGEGINYQFNQDQISSLRQIALMRKSQGNGQTGANPQYSGGSVTSAPSTPAATAPATPAGNNNKLGGGNTNNNGGNTGTITYPVPTYNGGRTVGAGSNGGVRHSRPVAPAAPIAPVAAPAQPAAPAPVTTVYPVVTVYPEANTAPEPAAPATPAEAGTGNEQSGEENEQQNSDDDCDDDNDSEGESTSGDDNNSSGGNGYSKRAMDTVQEATEPKLIHIARRAFQVATPEAVKQALPLARVTRGHAVVV